MKSVSPSAAEPPEPFLLVAVNDCKKCKEPKPRTSNDKQQQAKQNTMKPHSYSQRTFPISTPRHYAMLICVVLLLGLQAHALATCYSCAPIPGWEGDKSSNQQSITGLEAAISQREDTIATLDPEDDMVLIASYQASNQIDQDSIDGFEAENASLQGQIDSGWACCTCGTQQPTQEPTQQPTQEPTQQPTQ